MYIGKTINAGQTESIQNPPNDVIRISNICFEGKPQEVATVFIHKDDQKIMLCSLSQHRPQASLDLYFLRNENISFSVQGQGKVHLCGYCEPSEISLSQESAQKETKIV